MLQPSGLAKSKNSKLKSPLQHLKSAREQLTDLISSPTTSPVAAVASKTSDVAPNAPTVGEAVAPISTSFSGRVIRRPTLYKDTRR